MSGVIYFAVYSNYCFRFKVKIKNCFRPGIAEQEDNNSSLRNCKLIRFFYHP